MLFCIALLTHLNNLLYVHVKWKEMKGTWHIKWNDQFSTVLLNNHWAHSFTFLYVKNITCRKMIEIRKDAEMTWAEDYVQTWGAAVERQSIWVVPGCGDNWEWRFLSLLFPFCHLQRQLMPLTKYGKILWEPLIQNGFYFWDYFGQSYWFDAFLNKFKMVTNLWLFNRQIFKLLSSN